MGGLGPGIGGFELVVIGLVALLVVGPKDLPILMRRVGQMVAKARAMANEFRASFDEMARQSELDELRKEVEALRKGQGVYPLGAEADAAFKDINAGLKTPAEALPSPEPAVEATGVSEWPDEPAPVETVEPTPQPKPKRAAKPKAATKAAPTKKAAASRSATAKPRSRTTRNKPVDL